MILVASSTMAFRSSISIVQQAKPSSVLFGLSTLGTQGHPVGISFLLTFRKALLSPKGFLCLDLPPSPAATEYLSSLASLKYFSGCKAILQQAL